MGNGKEESLRSKRELRGLQDRVVLDHAKPYALLQGLCFSSQAMESHYRILNIKINIKKIFMERVRIYSVTPKVQEM